MILRFKYNDGLEDVFYDITGMPEYLIRQKVLSIHNQLKKSWIEEQEGNPYEEGFNADILMEYIKAEFPELSIEKVFLNTINFDE